MNLLELAARRGRLVTPSQKKFAIAGCKGLILYLVKLDFWLEKIYSLFVCLLWFWPGKAGAGGGMGKGPVPDGSRAFLFIHL